ncbi:hypothetical protein BJV74DRAFT_375252 [Russula compacta]|nr:hypothetical protein BJV74DRAFT_375252 [Russula compacta]
MHSHLIGTCRSSTIDNAFTYQHSRVKSTEKPFGTTSAHGAFGWTSPLRMRPSRHQLAAEGTISGFMPSCEDKVTSSAAKTPPYHHCR